MSGERLCFDRARFQALLDSLERMAAGDLEGQIPLTGERDELDALSHGVNVLSAELLHRLRELQTAQSSIIQAGRLTALGEVSSGLAHELNNPLMVIAGYLELIRGDIQARPESAFNFAELESHLQKIERNVGRMKTIIRHIMEFARESKPVKQPMQLNEVIKKSFILMNEQLRLKKIDIDMDLDPALVAHIDETRMEQVFINLLTKARDAIVEAHGEAGGRIQVRSRILSASELEIEISDNGIGMNEEIMSRIFNPFFTTKDVGKGTGLGLSISHGIVQDHGGSIYCASERGRGATFRIRLPRCNLLDKTTSP
jgi:C4-dicarboxylate-specific signal transduction histidine kinase